MFVLTQIKDRVEIVEIVYYYHGLCGNELLQSAREGLQNEAFSEGSCKSEDMDPQLWTEGF